MTDTTAEQAAYLTAMIQEQCPDASIDVEVDVDAEIITACIDGLPYVFEIGSDDDEYVFVHGDDVIVVPLED